MGMQSLDDLTKKTAEKLNALYQSIAGLAEAGVSSDFENSLSLGSDDKPYFKERTNAEIKTDYESNSDTNVFNDSYKGILDNLDTDLTNKLDRGGYTGTAQDLKDDIDGFVSGVSSDTDNSLTLGSDDKPYYKEKEHADGSWKSKSDLSKATVLSNLSVDKYGHATDWKTRELSASDVGASDSSHTHAWKDISDKPTTFSPSTHNHDDRYYTESESDERFLGKNEKASDADKVDGKHIWTGTQAQYDALSIKDTNTLYFIT